MYKKILSQVGLTPSQVAILDHLYRNKEAKASEISRKIRRSRAMVYKDTEKLEELGLIERTEKPNCVATFSAKHPSLLKKLLETKEKQLERSKRIFKTYLPEVISAFNLNHDRPGIMFYEGVEGLREIYDEILSENKDFFLIRTAYEPIYNQKIAPIVDDFIRERVKKKIKVKAIIPSDVNNPSKDALWLLKRYNVDKNAYTAPVEIDIFGDKIAILSFGKELVGIIIESKQIAQSLKQFFAIAALGAEMSHKES